jgi:hypothetical protein
LSAAPRPRSSARRQSGEQMKVLPTTPRGGFGCQRSVAYNCMLFVVLNKTPRTRASLWAGRRPRRDRVRPHVGKPAEAALNINHGSRSSTGRTPSSGVSKAKARSLKPEQSWTAYDRKTGDSGSAHDRRIPSRSPSAPSAARSAGAGARSSAASDRLRAHGLPEAALHASVKRILTCRTAAESAAGGNPWLLSATPGCGAVASRSSRNRTTRAARRGTAVAFGCLLSVPRAWLRNARMVMNRTMRRTLRGFIAAACFALLACSETAAPYEHLETDAKGGAAGANAPVDVGGVTQSLTVSPNATKTGCDAKYAADCDHCQHFTHEKQRAQCYARAADDYAECLAEAGC